MTLKARVKYIRQEMGNKGRARGRRGWDGNDVLYSCIKSSKKNKL